MANSMQIVINCIWLWSICSHGGCTGKLPRVIHFSWLQRYVARLPFHHPSCFSLFPFTFIISRMLMYRAAMLEAGIYHFLITVRKWICGHLHRGSVTATLDMKRGLFFLRRFRPRRVVTTSVCSAAARHSDGERCRGNYGPSRGEALLEYL